MHHHIRHQSPNTLVSYKSSIEGIPGNTQSPIIHHSLSPSTDSLPGRLGMEIAHEPPPSLDGSPTAAQTLATSPSSSPSSSSSSASSPRDSKGKEIDATSSVTATTATTAPQPAAKYDDEEDEEDVCRICRNPGDAENPLRYPCACSGSIKFVHQDCLLQWLNHSNARQCEVLPSSFMCSLFGLIVFRNIQLSVLFSLNF